jgi:hypothetical protein
MVVAWKHSADPVQGRAAGELCLRIVGTARNGQIVRLSAPKCTIGSAPGCALRLRAVGVRPVHCVILRGTNATLARAWAPETRLNGVKFTDAPLAAGDRLSIGPVELEIVDIAHVPGSGDDAGGAGAEQAPTQFTDSHQQRAERQRVRRLITALREARAELQAALAGAVRGDELLANEFQSETIQTELAQQRAAIAQRESEAERLNGSDDAGRSDWFAGNRADFARNGARQPPGSVQRLRAGQRGVRGAPGCRV